MERPLRQFNVGLGSEMALLANQGASAILSPDGNRLVFRSGDSDATASLYTRPLSQPEATLLSGTEGARNPFFSPDGEWVGFFADTKLKKISVQGGAAVTLCAAADDRGGSWGEDGRIVLGRREGGLLRVPAAGGAPEPLTELDGEASELSHRWPQVLPGGKAVLFTSHSAGQGSFDNAGIVVQSLDAAERKTLLRGATYGRYLPSGHLVYIHQNTLFAAPIDLDRLELLGPPAPMLVRVVAATGNGGAQFDFSRTGMLVYLSGEGTSIARSIHWLDDTGQTEPLPAEPGRYFTPRLSPDGERLAVVVNDAGNWDVWVYDWGRDTMSRLTFAPERDAFLVWTPDGEHIAFRSERDESVGNIYLTRADGAGQPQRLTESKIAQYPFSFSPDGRRLAYHVNSPETAQDIWTIPLEASDSGLPQAGQGELFLSTPATEVEPKFSPDGRWLAYTSTESGSSEIYVRPFPGPGGKWQISNGGGGGQSGRRTGGSCSTRAPTARSWLSPTPPKEIRSVPASPGSGRRPGILPLVSTVTTIWPRTESGSRF